MADVSERVDQKKEKLADKQSEENKIDKNLADEIIKLLEAIESYKSYKGKDENQLREWINLIRKNSY